MNKLLYIISLLTVCAQVGAGEVRQTKRIQDLEVTLRLESKTLTYNRPFPVEVVVKNAGSTDMIIGDRLVFLKNFGMKIFDLTYSEPVSLTRLGRWCRDDLRGKYREITLAPGESATFLEPSLDRMFDLSVQATYQLELWWYPPGVVYDEPPREIPGRITFSVEFSVAPDPAFTPPPPPARNVVPTKQR